jgi:hypothetical protein
MKINLMEQGPNPARSANTNLHTPSGNTRSITGMEARWGGLYFIFRDIC